MWTFLTTPIMSVNCRLTNRTCAFSAVAKTSFLSLVLSVTDIYSTPSCWNAAQRGANFERELQVQAHLRILEVSSAQELLNALESIDQGVAMDIQVSCRTHVIPARAKKSVQRAHELGASRQIRR